MSLLDNFRQTITDVAGTVVEQSRQLSNQTQLQLQIKKLQLERAKRIHELGKQTFAWYQSGQLSVSGPVPSDVVDVCRQLEDVERQLNATETELEEVGRQAQQALDQQSATFVNPDPATSTAPPPGYPPQPPQSYYPPPQTPPPPGQPYPQQPYPGQPYPGYAQPGQPPQGQPPQGQPHPGQPPHGHYPPPPQTPPPPAPSHATVVLPGSDPNAPHQNPGTGPSTPPWPNS